MTVSGLPTDGRTIYITMCKCEVIVQSPVFPGIWGSPFASWYLRFAGLDGLLDWVDYRASSIYFSEAEVVKGLERAKEAKQAIEADLPK